MDELSHLAAKALLPEKLVLPKETVETIEKHIKTIPIVDEV